MTAKVAATWQDCVQEGLDWQAIEPSTPADAYCQDNERRCPRHPVPKQRAVARAPARKVDLASPHKIQVIDGRMCMSDGIVIDGELAVNSVMRTPKGTVIRFWVKRRDGETLLADMRPGVMEQAALWNEWLTKVAAINGRIDKNSRQALKDYVFTQIEMMPAAHCVTNAGHVEAWDVLAFANGWIDAAGVLHRTVDGARSTDLLVGGPGNGVGQRKTLYLQASDLGGDVPSLPAVVSPALMEPDYLGPRGVLSYPGPRGDAMVEGRNALLRFLDAAHVNYGNHAVAMGLGYMMAHAVSPTIFKAFDRFPHLYITGPYQTGKDTLARYLCKASLGNERAVLKAGQGTTPKALRNALGGNSLHPLWVNEIRGNPDEVWMDSFIRASYDRQGSATTNIDQERVEFPVRRSMMLTGEAVAGSGAEFSRYVEIHLKPVANPAAQDALDALVGDARAGWAALMADWHRAAPAILESVRAARAGLMQAGCDERRAFGWGCVLGGLAWLYSPAACDPAQVLPQSVWKEALERCGFAMTRSKDGGAFARFWEAAGIAKRKDFLNQTGADQWVWLAGDNNDQMALATRKLIARTEDATRIKMPDQSLVSNELVRLPCFLKQEVMDVPHRGIRQRATVMLFDLKHPDVEDAFPGWVLDQAHRDTIGVFNQSAWDANAAARKRKP